MKLWKKSIWITLLVSTFAPIGMGGSAVAADGGQNCAVRLEPTGSGEGVGAVLTAPVDLGCYETLADAVAVGTGGTVTLPAGTSAGELTQSMLDSGGASTASSFLLGIEYDDTSYGGSSLSYFASGDCVGTTWEDSYVGDTWNDRFESGKGFSSCDHNKKFEHKQFGGAILTCTPNCSTYGVLRNEVSSLRWKD